MSAAAIAPLEGADRLGEYRGVPVMVLGATGFIGGWLVKALQSQGAVVTAVARDARASGAFDASPSGVRLLIDDLGDPAAPERLLAAADPAIVFNLAGYGVDRSERDPERMTAINAELVAGVCAALTGRARPSWTGARLVHAGSALEYGRQQEPLSETLALRPDTDYGRSKARGTEAVEAWTTSTGIPAVVARLFTVYGCGEHQGRLLPSLLHTARTGVPLALSSGRQPRNFTYVEDVTEGLLRLGLTPPAPATGTVVNLASDRLTSVRVFAETAAAVLGIDPARLTFGALADRDDEMWHGKVEVSRLRALTGWLPPTSIADGILKTRKSCDALTS